MVTDFAARTPGVRYALAVSADGLRLAASDGLDDGLADRLAAAASGLLSLARGTATLLSAGFPTQTIVEMTDGYLFLGPVGHGAVLAVHTDRDCDIGMLGYEMTMLARQVGHALELALRTPGAAG
nr:roadblock/LC7 domain-containing protein [Pseudonocardia sp. C8]